MNAKLANEIQVKWMALSGNEPKAVQYDVIKLVESLPTSHLTIQGNGTACVVFKGQPAHPGYLGIAEALMVAARYGVQTALQFTTEGKWMDSAA